MMTVTMIPVASSNVAEVGYKTDMQTVYVKFHNGSTYAYHGVPEMEFEALKNSPSVGSYLHRNYKNVYPYERVS